MSCFNGWPTRYSGTSGWVGSGARGDTEKVLQEVIVQHFAFVFRILVLYLKVPRPGLEPGWVAPLVFETSASTDSAIWASKAVQRYE